MRKLLILLFIFLLSFACAGVTKRKNQAYCYNDKGMVKGDNIDKELRIASLSKLFASNFIAEKMGLDHQYETTFELTTNKRLIIRGSKDPYFLEHGIFYIISTLVNAGVNSVLEVVVDDKFYFHFETDQRKFIDKLKFYFNTNKWNSTVTGNRLKLGEQYRQISQLVEKRLGIKFTKSPIFSATNVRKLTKKDIRPGSTSAKWVLPSVKMIHYLKILNSYSNNMTTDEFVKQLGGMRGMNKFYRDLGYRINFVTGSGLNTGSGKSRRDNYASCRKVLMVMDELKEKLKLAGLSPSDLLPMASDDVGTLSSRFGEWGFRESFVFKTGTLKKKPTSAIAAMHRSKSLNLVVLAQDYSGYPQLKANEINLLGHMVKKLSLKPIKKDYEPKDFLMFNAMRRASF